MLRTVVGQARFPRNAKPFITLPNFSPFGGAPSGQNNNEGQKYHERKMFPYKPKELYDVIANVSSYPQFVPYCTNSRILQQYKQNGETHMDAELSVGFLAFQESYVSKVICKPYESVEVFQATAASTMLFNELKTIWRIQPTSTRSPGEMNNTPDHPTGVVDNEGGPTLVTLDLTFAFANPVYALASSTFFKQVSQQMVKAFEDRCIHVYGRRSL
ncbi:hypothetical protein CONPUDRAFT_53959 [Coniophora puteana RWD-64-598 SS2]|uniref:Coenzyme Q-binding protein COQ10 START domain-containing protein n=1 Tax=Coniophora puteana (strain RWD-64-598) TaxID=741705 RepID=A0A5M3MTQ5_CONPW|nr:uncharacterized protein CONPUDRAFT_53959 [Coniophora puteana RWD-64-598 SS2]EIW82055.1 hypothetical protein CONPUDRAFT_53959 [Coniophora puteana RWD-64-598 SS2]